MKVETVGRKRLWTIFGVIFSIIVITVVVTPTVIVLKRKGVTTATMTVTTTLSSTATTEAMAVVTVTIATLTTTTTTKIEVTTSRTTTLVVDTMIVSTTTIKATTALSTTTTITTTETTSIADTMITAVSTPAITAETETASPMIDTMITILSSTTTISEADTTSIANTIAVITSTTTTMPTTEIMPTTTTMPTTLLTKPPSVIVFKRTNETVYAIWNTTAGGDSTPSSPGAGTGTYWRSEPPKAAFDGNITTDYTNHGVCRSNSNPSVECGLNTGFYLTLAGKSFILVKFHMASNGNSRYRDPQTITIEGSNHEESQLTFGQSWTLIYNGSTGLVDDPGRSTFGILQTLPKFSLPFASYRLLVTSKSDKQTCVGYSEFVMTGTFVH